MFCQYMQRTFYRKHQKNSSLIIKGEKLETTLILIKPIKVQRSLSGEILSRLEKSGLKISGLKLLHVDEKLAKQHYVNMKENHFSMI